MPKPEEEPKPGDPIADIVYNILMAYILDKIQAELATHNIGFQCPATQTRQLHGEVGDFTRHEIDSTYVDDVALLIAANNDNILNDTKTAIAIAIRWGYDGVMIRLDNIVNCDNGFFLEDPSGGDGGGGNAGWDGRGGENSAGDCGGGLQ